MHGDLADRADARRALLDAAKIEGTAHAQRADDLDIGSSELAEMVGAEDVPPARGTAICGRIAAEVAKIAGALQGEMAGRDVLSGGVLSGGVLSGSVLHEISLRYGSIGRTTGVLEIYYRGRSWAGTRPLFWRSPCWRAEGS